MKRFMFIIPHRADGGTQRVVSIWAKQLARRSMDIHIVQFYHGANEYGLDAGVSVHVLSNGDPSDYRRQGTMLKLLRLRGVMKKVRPDAIVTFLGTTGTKALLAGWGLGIPIFTTVRNNPRCFGSNRWDRWLRNVTILCSRGCLVQTPTQLDFLPGWVRHKARILPNPVAGELAAINKIYRPTPKLLVSAGRLTKQKDFPLLIRSFARVHQQYPRLELHIYGEGELAPDLQSMIERLGLAASVLLRGRSDDLWREFSRADIFVLSSRFEGMPNVLMEAMAVGLPCISTDCPTGPAELITHGWNGILVPTGDESELAAAIRYLVEFPGRGHQMGQRARSEVLERYDLSANTEELISYISAT